MDPPIDDGRAAELMQALVRHELHKRVFHDRYAAAAAAGGTPKWSPLHIPDPTTDATSYPVPAAVTDPLELPDTDEPKPRARCCPTLAALLEPVESYIQRFFELLALLGLVGVAIFFAYMTPRMTIFAVGLVFVALAAVPIFIDLCKWAAKSRELGIPQGVDPVTFAPRILDESFVAATGTSTSAAPLMLDYDVDVVSRPASPEPESEFEYDEDAPSPPPRAGSRGSFVKLVVRRAPRLVRTKRFYSPSSRAPGSPPTALAADEAGSYSTRPLRGTAHLSPQSSVPEMNTTPFLI
ncbi:hypothetical protein H9P43_002190 [Blastocladiella emersonii ATCC 22665]|nr:hypothetical protein H9P43_002190 [Blastocladiella emersonii ATCC 22665]